jgi:hypothetical protein
MDTWMLDLSPEEREALHRCILREMARFKQEMQIKKRIEGDHAAFDSEGQSHVD